MTFNTRKIDILKLVESLDIPPSLYKNAVEKYTNIAHYLQSNGFAAEMYPQGSFALGTVVRPVKNDEDASYDLDFICQVSTPKENISAQELWKRLKKVLSESPYANKMLEYETCFTIEYADINNIGFSIDIVPAVDESFYEKSRLISISDNPSLINTAIALPDHRKNKCDWLTNNPKGYRHWFENINTPFMLFARDEHKRHLFESCSNIYQSIEEIPDELVRSSLQRVIQILKKHRDVYYNSIPNGDEKKPISAILNTIVAKIAKNQAPSISVFDLLRLVLDTLINKSSRDELIAKENNKWVVLNPANPKDNLADSWDSDIYDKFIKWINIAYTDLILSQEFDDAQFRSHMENAFGHRIINRHWKDKYCPIKPRPIIPSTAPKPWGQI